MAAKAEETTLTDIQVPLTVPQRHDCIVVIHHPDRAQLGRRVNLTGGPVRIGRKQDNDIVLAEDAVSRRHARLERRGATWMLMDTGSQNGTRVNDGSLSGVRPLQNGDRVKIGSTILKYLSGSDVENLFFREIFQMTITDNLTQLANRRAFDEELHREYFRARRHGRSLSLLMIDIDHFKRINDGEGHQAGDAVLQHFGKQLQGRARQGDLAARIGGEEFAIVLPETGLGEARSIGESLRSAIADSRAGFQGRSIGITISVGVAELATTDQSVFDFQTRCDARLYAAKHGGRNRVEG